MKEMTIGCKGTVTTIAAEDKLAVNVGSGDLRVFARILQIIHHLIEGILRNPHSFGVKFSVLTFIDGACVAG